MRGFEKVSYINDVVLPIRATSKSAGYDLSIIEDIVIEPGQVIIAKTGLKAYMNDDEVLKIYIRSSLGFKKNLRLANSVGIIDADYYNNEDNEGHIMCALHNFGTKKQVLNKGERVAQGIFEKFLVVEDDQANGKRDGGFGSTS